LKVYYLNTIYIFWKKDEKRKLIDQSNHLYFATKVIFRKCIIL